MTTDKFTRIMELLDCLEKAIINRAWLDAWRLVDCLREERETD